MSKVKTNKWIRKTDYMDNEVLWERMIGDFGENMAFEMYAIQYVDYTNTYYVGGGTFKLTDYPAEERNFHLVQHNIDPTDTSFENVMKLAEAIFTANLADFSSIEAFTDKVDAERYMDDLVRTSPWNAS